MHIFLIAALIPAGPAFSQPVSHPAAFEVASVKITQFAKGGGEERGGVRRGIKTSPGSVSIQAMPLTDIVQWAYGVKEYQVDGPRWTDTVGFDIFAKAQGPAGDIELQSMMRTLLAERFKLEFHRQNRELPVYDMIVAKGGHKLKPSSGEGESRFNPGPGGGKMALHAEKTTMAQFADLLSRPLQRPVLDKTGLTGSFDFTIDLMSYIPLDANGKPAPDKVAVEDRDTIILMALQQQLGLKLEPKKAPVEVLIIDHAEQVPVEN